MAPWVARATQRAGLPGPNGSGAAAAVPPHINNYSTTEIERWIVSRAQQLNRLAGMLHNNQTRYQQMN